MSSKQFLANETLTKTLISSLLSRRPTTDWPACPRRDDEKKIKKKMLILSESTRRGEAEGGRKEERARQGS
jgi:hypothetical protein